MILATLMALAAAAQDPEIDCDNAMLGLRPMESEEPMRAQMEAAE